MSGHHVATIRMDPREVRPSRVLRALARNGGPLVVLTQNALGDLVDELGGYDEAVRDIYRVASNTGRPIGVNLPNGPDASRTVIIPPKGWTSERLMGWVAGHHELLEQQFGAVASVEEPEVLAI